MEVLAINGSARGPKGVTQRLLDALAAGLQQGGAAVTVLQVKDLAVAPCTACLTCFHKTPGVCAQRDDMDRVSEHLKAAELFVMATPLYTDGMTAQIKAVMDRCICSMQPYLALGSDGRTRHPMNWAMPQRFLLLSTCGLPEPGHFAPLRAAFRAQAANFSSRPLAELLVPGSIALQMEPSLLEPHLALISRAGRQIAAQGEIAPALLAAINRPPLSVDRYRELAARYEDWCRAKRNEN